MDDLNKLKIDRDAKISAGSTSRYSHLTRYTIIIVAVVAVIYFFSGTGAGLLQAGVKVETANVVTAWPAQSLALFNATGYVVPQTRADIASKATGRLEILYVEEGSVVKKDQILAQLENRDVIAVMERAKAGIEAAKSSVNEAQARRHEAMARVEEAKAELHDAERRRKRAEELEGKKFVSPEVNDAAIARHEKAVASLASIQAAVGGADASVQTAGAQAVAAEAAYREAEVAVEYTYIRAPFDGVILSKHADIGDVVAPFATSAQSKGSVVSMADLSTMQVEADISESNLTLVHVGQPCEIQLDALPEVRLRGEVHMIVPTVDRTKATVLAKVRFVDQDKRILPDMSARVTFLPRALEAEEQVARTVLPPAAVVMLDGQQVVFRIEENIVREVQITTGGQLGDMIIVSAGVSSGDKVVLNPPENLRDGMKVKLPPG